MHASAKFVLASALLTVAASAAAITPPSPQKKYVTEYTFLCPAANANEGPTTQNTTLPGQFQVVKAPCSGGQLMSWVTRVVTDN